MRLINMLLGLPELFGQDVICRVVRFIVPTAVIDAKDCSCFMRHLEQDCHATPETKRSQPWAKVITFQTSLRKGSELVTVVHNGIDKSAARRSDDAWAI